MDVSWSLADILTQDSDKLLYLTEISFLPISRKTCQRMSSHQYVTFSSSPLGLWSRAIIEGLLNKAHKTDVMAAATDASYSTALPCLHGSSCGLGTSCFPHSCMSCFIPLIFYQSAEAQVGRFLSVNAKFLREFSSWWMWGHKNKPQNEWWC